MKKTILSILILLYFNCSEKNPTDYLVITEPPVISGIRVTANYHAQEDSVYQDYRDRFNIVIEDEILGMPSYPMEGTTFPEIDVYPNPFIISHNHQTHRYDPYIVFLNMPPETRIEIYRGRFFTEDPEESQTSSVVTKAYRPVAVLENGTYSHRSWNFRSDSGGHAPSGLYRAYFYHEEELINFVDFYFILHYDCDFFIDPTGWLPDYTGKCDLYKNGTLPYF